MIHLERDAEPDILIKKKAAWLANFIASGNRRPPHAQYAHPTVKDALYTISHHKCYYCERQLKDVKEEVDHQIEVAIDNTLAFEWGNLYLACDNCNDKQTHNQIAIANALDPFRNSNIEIEEHITFEKEIIRIKNASTLGDRTIKKSLALRYKSNIVN